MKHFLALLIATLLTTSGFGALRVYNSAGTYQGRAEKMKCSTGVTCAISGKEVTVTANSLSGDLTLQSGEVISNSTDDTVSVASEDEVTTFLIKGFEAKNAILQLYADEGDDAADKYSLTADTSGNLTLKNDTTSLLVVSSAGVLTLADSETLTNASDVVTLAADDAAFSLVGKAFEATDAKFTLQADESDDNGDDWQIASVASGNTLTISNDTSGSQVAKITVAASDGDITLTGGILGDGGDSLSGLLQAQVASTTTTATAAQCGSTFVSDSADTITLPEASTVLGCRYTFVCGTADDFVVNPNDATDVIGTVASITGTNTTTVLAPAAGDSITCTDIGSSIVIEAVGANLWASIGNANGIWTDTN